MNLPPWKRWLGFGACLLFVLIPFWTAPKQSMDFGALFFGLGSLVFLFQPWINARAVDIKAKRLCRITERGFSFGRYEFPFGTMKGRSTLPFAEVDEIRLNTWPVTALVNGNELVFLSGLERDAVRKSADEHSIPVREPTDVWGFIGEQFLDTKFEEAHKERTLLRLEHVGLSSEEVRIIRKRLRLRMLAWAYSSMEWVYCGQYDVLIATDLLWAKTYWWSMEIALRGSAAIKDRSNLRKGSPTRDGHSTAQ